MKCEEAQEFITALVNNELSHDERDYLEVHLKNCQRCLFIYDQERELKKAIRSAGASVSTPAGLRRRILSDRRLFAEKNALAGGWKRLFWPLKTGLRPALVGATVFVLVVAGLYVMWPLEEPTALAALRTHEKIVANAIPIQRAGNSQEIKELLFRSVGAAFAPMEYDFSMAGLKAVGWLVQEVGGRKVLVTVYEGKGLLLSCYTFLGVEKDAPANAAVFFDPEKGKNFYTFSQGGINGVLQRVGERICILVSEMPLQNLITLAQSMA